MEQRSHRETERFRDIQDLEEVQTAFTRFVFGHELLTAAEFLGQVDLSEIHVFASDTQRLDEVELALIIRRSVNHIEQLGKRLQLPQNGVLRCSEH